MKKLTLIAILFCILGAGSLRADDYTDAMVKSIKKLNAVTNITDRTNLQKIRGDFERILQLKKNQWMVNYYIAMCDLFLAWSYYGDSTGTANLQKYNESCLSLLDKSTDLKDDFAEAYILKMSANSNRWSYEPNKMNDIIAKGTEAKEKAQKLDPKNPRFFVVDGTNLFYTPEMFGGGVDVAQPMFEKAWDLFTTYKPVDETCPDWGRDNAAGMIAMCYIKKDKLADAKKWIDKALEIVPGSPVIVGIVMPEYEKAGGK